MQNWWNWIEVIKGDPKEVFDFISSEQLLVDFNRVIPMPENIRNADPEARERWCVEHWGTKSNAIAPRYLAGRSNAMLFDTAWAPAVPVVEAIARKFPKHQFLADNDQYEHRQPTWEEDPTQKFQIIKRNAPKRDSLLIQPGTKEWLEVQGMKDKTPEIITQLEAQQHETDFLDSIAPATKASNTTRKEALASHVEGLLRWYFECLIFPPTRCEDEVTVNEVGGMIEAIMYSDIYYWDLQQEFYDLEDKAKEDAFDAAAKYFNENPTDADSDKFFQIYPECRGKSGPLSRSLILELTHRAKHQWLDADLCAEDPGAGSSGCGCEHSGNAA